MSEQDLRPQEIKTAWYKKPAFPWAILIGLTLLSIGVVGGWTLKTGADAQVHAEASTMVTKLSK